MESIKGFSLVNWIFVILGLICAFICPAFIQPWSTLTPAGVTIFFVFVGTLLMVIGSNSLIWPIFAAMAGLVAYGCTDGNAIAAALFSNGTVVNDGSVLCAPCYGNFYKCIWRVNVRIAIG